MSVFWPARKIVAPDGRAWEIYVSRFRWPTWKPYRINAGGGIWQLLSIPVYLVTEILWPLLRMLLTLPSAAFAAMRAETIRVEAISFIPWPEAHLWITTDDQLARILNQISYGLETGRVVQPIGADFRGSEEKVGATYRLRRRD